jgi:hypothetical protein
MPSEAEIAKGLTKAQREYVLKLEDGPLTPYGAEWLTYRRLERRGVVDPFCELTDLGRRVAALLRTETP